MTDLTYSELNKLAKTVWTIGYSGLTLNKGSVFLRIDTTDDLDPKEHWTNYCEISERLSEVKVQFKDPCIEHDCVSGFIEFISETEENLTEGILTEDNVRINQIYEVPTGNRFLKLTSDYSVWVGYKDGLKDIPINIEDRTLIKIGKTEVKIVGEANYLN